MERTIEDLCKYIRRNNKGVYYYRRRVPEDVKNIANKKTINVSLKTKDLETAIKKAGILTPQLESAWDDLRVNGGSDKEIKYKRAIKIAKLSGFQYLPAPAIAEAGPDEIMRRIRALEKTDGIKKEEKIPALLGGVEEPTLLLSEAFEVYRTAVKPDLINKSENQKRKWYVPRETALNKLIEAIGDKDISQLKREDIQTYKTSLVEKLEDGLIVAHTLNRNLERAKVVIRKVSEEKNIKLDVDQLFWKLKIKEHTKTRPAYPVEHVRDNILNLKKLGGLNTEAICAIAIVANTGIRPTEFCGLRKHHIHLDADIPYIEIKSEKDREIKTIQSNREIPLVGCALWAMKKLPNGPQRYFDKNDGLCSAIGKYFRENNLNPTDDHTFYSLRHTFQDLLRIHHTDERIQAELMGHEYERPKYGAPSLQEKYDVIKKFAFSINSR